MLERRVERGLVVVLVLLIFWTDGIVQATEPMLRLGSIRSLTRRVSSQLPPVRKRSGQSLTQTSVKGRYDNDDDDDEHLSGYDVGRRSRQPSAWPPWPFNNLRLGRQPSILNGEDSYDISGAEYQSNAVVVWNQVRKRMRIFMRQTQNFGSQLYFHLPPATPPLFLLSVMPIKNWKPFIFTDKFAQTYLLGSLGIAVMSWAHSEVNRKRRLRPLPLPEQYQDITKAFLPPFLPEEATLSDFSEVVNDEEDDDIIDGDGDTDTADDVIAGVEGSEGRIGFLSAKARKHFQSFYESGIQPLFQERRMPALMRQMERINVRRQMIYDELVALQALKKKAERKARRARKRLQRRGGKSDSSDKNPEDDLGYALVTGASRGIGRAIAIQLARWEIPLILVARDKQKMISLATDVTRCYGVQCCVILADLSEPDAAERIHEATTKAGLSVDILVNNAGISANGVAVDMDLKVSENIMQVNALSVAKLSYLYGRDMKQRGRGRILMVSSVVGAVYSGPSVATYAATKAFEKSLGLSIAKELEPYGVGVTCLMPGAVGDSSFRDRSGTSEALCWKLPGYAVRTQFVAEQGVRALLAGDVECVPGWMNRVFLKVCQPVLPQRLITLAVEAAWNPITLTKPWFFKLLEKSENATTSSEAEEQIAPIKPRSDRRQTLFMDKPNPPTVLEPERSEQETGSIVENEDDDTEINNEGWLPSRSEQPIEGMPESDEQYHSDDGQVVDGEDVGMDDSEDDPAQENSKLRRVELPTNA